MVPCNVVWIFHPGLVVPLMPPKNSIGETHGRPFSQQGQKMEEKPKKTLSGGQNTCEANKVHGKQDCGGKVGDLFCLWVHMTFWSSPVGGTKISAEES